jgi:lipid A disaccharide synthetase
VAGEPSGDLLAARLMKALRTLTPGRSIVFEVWTCHAEPVAGVLGVRTEQLKRGGATAQGVGGCAMQQQGLSSSLFPADELAVMGLAGVVPTPKQGGECVWDRAACTW